MKRQKVLQKECDLFKHEFAVFNTSKVESNPECSTSDTAQ